jgi:hypothetical protein
MNGKAYCPSKNNTVDESPDEMLEIIERKRRDYFPSEVRRLLSL